LVWIKTRSVADNHKLTDSVRGATKTLFSNTTDNEFTEANALTSAFESDGFALGDGAHLNGTGDSYVAWNWKAGGSSVSNSDGTITSSISANPEAGFSIVSYTGTGANATVGHGLSSAPQLVFIKNRDESQNWIIGSDSLTSWEYILQFTTAGESSSSNKFNSTAPSSSVFSVGTGVATNGSSDDMIAYCFTNIDQYCKAGVYSGNGNADGSYVALNFRPSWVMIKRTDASADWWILDNKRNSSNVVDLRLRPNSSSAEEGPDATFDFVANGLKIRGNYSTLNASGGTYIYLAFAEQPFKYSNAR